MHIHGKRARSKAVKDLAHPKRRGRPFKAPAQLALVEKDAILRKLQQHHSRILCKMDSGKEHLSTLEKLPVELLQQIFFYALEVNLPRASDYLRQTLSTDQIFDALVAFAYFDDDGKGRVETKHFLPADYRMLSCVEKVRLQQSIFSCQWCTYERIKSCLPALSRLKMVQAWREECESHEQGVNTGEGAITVPNQALRNRAPLPNINHEAKLEEHFLARTTIEELGNSVLNTRLRNAFLPRIVTWTSSLDDQGILHKSTDRSLSILATRHIPDWLLRNTPWTEAQLGFVHLLRQGYTFIQDDHVMSISAKAVFEGMRNAILESNVVALKTLLEIHNVFFKSGAWTIHNMIASPLSPSSHHPLPLDLFHLAARQQPRTTEMVSLLVRAGIDSLPKDDEIITAWAVHGSQQGNVLASWLLRHMEGTTDYGLPRRGYLFVDGCLSWRVRSRGDLPFPETSFATELGYIAGTPIIPAGVNGAPCGYDEE